MDFEAYILLCARYSYQHHLFTLPLLHSIKYDSTSEQVQTCIKYSCVVCFGLLLVFFGGAVSNTKQRFLVHNFLYLSNPEKHSTLYSFCGGNHTAQGRQSVSQFGILSLKQAAETAVTEKSCHFRLSYKDYITSCLLTRTTSVHTVLPRPYHFTLSYHDYITSHCLTKTTLLHAVFTLSYQDYITSCCLTRTISLQAVLPGLHHFTLSYQHSTTSCLLTRTISLHTVLPGLCHFTLSYDD